MPLNGAWSQQDPTFPFNQYLPNRIVRTAGRDRHLSDPRRHERDARAPTARSTRSIRRPGCRRAATSPRPSSSAPSIATCDALRAAVQLRRPARARRQPDARGALRRQQGARPARSARLQPGLRPERRTRPTTSSSGSTRRTSRPAAPTVRSTRAPRRASAASAGRSGSRTRALGGMLDYNLANAAGAVIGFEARGRSSGSTFRRRCCSTTPAARSTTRCSSTSEADDARGAVQHAAYLLALEGHELG